MSIMWSICIVVMSLLTILSVLRYKRTVKRRSLKGWHKILLICFSGLYVIGIGLVVSFLIIAICTLKPHVNQTTKPLSLEDAKEKCPIDLPDSAHDIQFSKYGAFMAIMRLVKFEAPVEDCVVHAKKILASFERKADYPNFKELTPIIKDKMMDKEYFIENFGSENDYADFKAKYIQKYTGPFSVPWFNPYEIRKGLEGGYDGSHSPQIWIDVERGIFYYRYRD